MTVVYFSFRTENGEDKEKKKLSVLFDGPDDNKAGRGRASKFMHVKRLVKRSTICNAVARWTGCFNNSWIPICLCKKIDAGIHAKATIKVGRAAEKTNHVSIE